MEQRPSYELNSHSDNQEIRCFLLNPKFHKSPPDALSNIS
jgi:hypothetical protein